MEAALELDDDVFFADLSRQISLLIMDDGDDAEDYSISSHYSSANLQRFANTFAPPSQASHLSYDHHHHQQHASKREIKGTGVFIPRSSHHRRNNNNNNNQGKSANNKLLRPYDQNSRGLIFPQMNYSNTNSNSTCEQSFNKVRRF